MILKYDILGYGLVMWKVLYIGIFVVLVIVFCLLFCMSFVKISVFEFVFSFECRNSYNLSEELVNKIVDEYYNYIEGLRFCIILVIFGKVLNSFFRFEIVFVVNIFINCLDYLDFIVLEVVLFLLNML